jgi:hypothetical protein
VRTQALRARSRLLCALALAATLTWVAQPAFACATCGCGDPTLTTLGTERPYRNRIRAGFEIRHRSDAIGEPRVSEIRIEEQRLSVYGAWAPTSDVFLQVEAPLLRRTTRYPNLASTSQLAAGDIELRGKLFLARDRAFSPRHIFAMLAGVKLPTAPRLRNPNGNPLLPEAQTGSGSVDPMLGLSYAYVPRPWSLYASAFAMAPIAPIPRSSGFRSSATARFTVTTQLQLAAALALRLGIDARFDGKSYEKGLPERDSGGFIAFVSPEVLLSPTTDVTFLVSLRYPALSALQGFHKEGPTLGLALGYDF